MANTFKTNAIYLRQEISFRLSFLFTSSSILVLPLTGEVLPYILLKEKFTSLSSYCFLLNLSWTIFQHSWADKRNCH